MEAGDNHTNEMPPSSSFQQHVTGNNSHHDTNDLDNHENGDNRNSLNSKHAGDIEVCRSKRIPISRLELQDGGDNLDHESADSGDSVDTADSDDSDDWSMQVNVDTPDGLDKEDAGDNEVVVLVVSNEQRHKFGIVDALTENNSACWKEEVTLSGTRILTRTSPARVVVDTTPLQCMSGKSPTAVARRWISQNSLRRVIVNKYVVVVCVITCSVLDESCNSSIFRYDNCWVDVLRILFKTHKGGVLTVVNAYNDTIDDRVKRRLGRFVRDHKLESKNIVYSSPNSGGDVVARILEESVGMKAIRGARTSRSVEAFNIILRKLYRSRIFGTPKEGFERTNIDKTANLRSRRGSRKDQFTAWDDERVILIGKAGSGKSTLAQMLTMGKVEPEATTFRSGSGIRGHTKEIEHGHGRGWYVVDTPGFGEPNHVESTVTTEDAQRKITTFVEMVDGVYAHFIFVLKKDRIDQLEMDLWKFFKELFGADLQRQFSIVISNADKDWMEKELDHLKRSFKGCDSFLRAEFPSTWTLPISQNLEASQDLQQDLRAEEEEIQRESLEELEDQLAELKRTDRPCEYGHHSRMNKVVERNRSFSDMKIERSPRTKMLAGGSEVLFHIDELAFMLMNFFNIDPKCTPRIPPLKLT